MCTFNSSQNSSGALFGWSFDGTELKKKNNLDIAYPLKYLLNIFEDHKKIMVNSKLELILNRAKNDLNVYSVTSAEAGKKVSIKLKKLNWNVEHVQLNDIEKIKIFKSIEKGDNYPIIYRHWDIFTNPMISKTMNQSFTIKTTSAIERPRYVIVFFQNDKRESDTKNATHIDHMKIRNIRLYLNDQVWPYMNSDLNFDVAENKRTAILYYNYLNFRENYDQKSALTELMTRDLFIKNYPLYIIDCSHQNENIKTAIDVKIEIESSGNFPEKVNANIIIVSEKRFNYNSLYNTVNRVLM